jgi:hypothetical protein
MIFALCDGTLGVFASKAREAGNKSGGSTSEGRALLHASSKECALAAGSNEDIWTGQAYTQVWVGGAGPNPEAVESRPGCPSSPSSPSGPVAKWTARRRLALNQQLASHHADFVSEPAV